MLECLAQGAEKEGKDAESTHAVQKESLSVLYDCCDESHKKCARVLMARAKEIPKLDLLHFHEIFEMMLGFCVDGEKLLEVTLATDDFNSQYLSPILFVSHIIVCMNCRLLGSSARRRPEVFCQRACR